jgi:predicted DNA-binding protein
MCEFPMIESIRVRLPFEQKAALRVLARRRGVSVSDLIRETVNQMTRAAA